ncbi:hypothetical protein MKEN_01336600 [Mycena kentingensis (nom. inval.)]|nr:hypothetical protein MKEN_01336600 [Mycena kentingensis (nom. inval.)]
MDALPPQPLKRGLVDLAGSTPRSAQLTTELLHKDFLEHHCYFNDAFFHDHLAHHLLAVHDLGGSEKDIQRVFDLDVGMQRPLEHGKKGDGVAVTEENWRDALGERHSGRYSDYIAFFSARIAKDGVARTLEKYLFSPEANGNGVLMLARFFGGAIHPIIQTGYGVEFGQDSMVAQGLALAVLTTPEGASLMEPSGLPEIAAQPAQDNPTPSLISLFNSLTALPAFTPIPTADLVMAPRPDGDVVTSFVALIKWVKDHPAHTDAIRATYTRWRFGLSDADLERKADECLWQAVLLLGGSVARSGAGAGGTKSESPPVPKMDFFLMHLLTSALTLRPLLSILQKAEHKAQLLTMYARTAALVYLIRGSPKVDCARAMAYRLVPQTLAARIGDAASVEDAWRPILENARLHTEAHVPKAIRALYYCTQRFGSLPAGFLCSSSGGDEQGMMSGAERVDGSVFLRVAGAMSDALGWPLYDGQKSERDWDFSGYWDQEKAKF